MSIYCRIPSFIDAPDRASDPRPQRPLDRAARLGVAALAILVICFAAWQFVMPDSFASVRGLNPLAIAAWRAEFRWRPAPVSLALYTAVFRILLALPFAVYGAVLWGVARGARIDARWTVCVAVGTIVVLAVAMPASLSTDVFAYVGYGRLRVAHGLNPHLATQMDLVRLGDPTAPYLRWPIPSPYGPLWTLLSMGLVRWTSAQSVWGAVVAFKVIAGVALLAAAAAARAIVRRGPDAVSRSPWSREIRFPTQEPSPSPDRLVSRAGSDRGDATFALVALNPLLLIEGPGNGHNDLVMVALVLAGFAALRMRRPHAAAFLVGLSAAIKVVPLLLVPWLAVLAVRSASPRWRGRLVAAGATLVLGLAPTVVSYLPFWAGTRTLSGLVERWQSADDATSRAPSATPTRASADAARASTVGAIQPTTREQTGRAAVIRVLARTWPALLVMLWASLAICFGRGDPVFRLATVWGIVATAVVMFGAGLWFPWYLAWIWPVAVLRFTRPHVALCAFALVFSLLLMFPYSMPPG